MRLTAQQLDLFEREGYLFFPAMFQPADIAVLLDAVPRLYAQQQLAA